MAVRNARAALHCNAVNELHVRLYIVACVETKERCVYSDEESGEDTEAQAKTDVLSIAQASLLLQHIVLGIARRLQHGHARTALALHTHSV